MRRWFLCVILVFALTGCAREEPAFNWQVAALPTNLDPQAAREDSDLLAVRHLFRGLYRLDEKGQPRPDGCLRCVPAGESWRVILSRENRWWDGEPVLARDYVFGIRRSLDPDTGSPYREELSAIEEISAESAYTLRLTLSPGADLPELLACPGAYPCREDFFYSCQGQYGLTRQTTLGNGVFALQGWGSSIFTLSRVEGEGISLLRFTLPGSSLPPSGQVLPRQTGTAADTWVLAMNPGYGPLTEPLLRQSIGGLLIKSALPLPEYAVKAGQLVPPFYGAPMPLPDCGDFQELLWAAVRRLDCLYLEGLSIAVCPERLELARAICQQLQGRLGITCSLRVLSERELTEAVESGDYSLALLSLPAAGRTAEDFWAQCLPLCGLPEGSPADIMGQWCLIPLYHQRLRLVTDPCWAGVQYSPFTRQPDFTRAVYQP